MNLRFAMLALLPGLLLGGQSTDARRDWSARLQRLDPAWPSAYFELGEEIADVAVTKEEKDIARTLFALAGALDREGHGRSSALALAQLAEDARRRRALVALAVLLNDRGAGTAESMPFDGAVSAGERGPSAQAALAFSEALSHFRRGQGPRATSAMKNPEVESLLLRYGTGSPGGADRFREDCRVYKGGLRPQLASDMRASMLAIEEAVLASAGREQHARTWSSVLVETAGRPLIEIDAARLDEAFGVDVARPYFRGGRWTSEPK